MYVVHMKFYACSTSSMIEFYVCSTYKRDGVLCIHVEHTSMPELSCM